MKTTHRFSQVELTGSRLVCPLTKLGFLGPKHHAIVIGKSAVDQQIYVAENRQSGYQLTSLKEFQQRNSKYGYIRIEPNTGRYSNGEVAQRALQEMRQGSKGKYHLLTNNCETFSNRAMLDKSVSAQVINTCVGVVMVAGALLALKSGRWPRI